jgi:predicted O-methyltransferase YrrM
MIALEGAPDLAALAVETYAELGLDMVEEVRVGPFAETLGDAITDGVDFAYVDGHHDGRATLEYFERLLPHAPQALLAFDDVRWSEGMREAWRQIANDDRVSFAVNAKRLGLAFTGSP